MIQFSIFLEWYFVKRLIFLISLLFISVSSFAGITQVDGKWSSDRFVPTASVEEHYDIAYQALYENQWDVALRNFMIIHYHFAASPFHGDALFYSAICYYFKGEFDLSNRVFDSYLASGGKLKHFEKVFEFKYHIADYYKQGRRKHLFGLSILPKWSSGRGDAIDLYDEIIAALPGKEIAAEALYAKAGDQRRLNEYRESIETLQTLIRRFPKHSLAADSYVKISEVYLDQSIVEAQNPDLISLAKVNLARFGRSFPGDERIEVADANALAMQEEYASSLYKTGRFYERKKKPHASLIYYQDALAKYPLTEAASKSQERIERLR